MSNYFEVENLDANEHLAGCGFMGESRYSAESVLASVLWGLSNLFVCVLLQITQTKQTPTRCED